MKTAIIELSSSHGECIYSQAKFLDEKGIETVLILNKELKDQSSFSLASITGKYYLETASTILGTVKLLFSVRNICKQNNIKRIILNTATGTLVWELLLILPKKIKIAGIIHDANKFIRSKTQKRINKKITKYFVLNDFIKYYIIENNINEIKSESFYPIYFPPYKNIDLQKAAKDLWIVIPGKVEQKRRNYMGLLKQLGKQKLPQNIKFILLGPCFSKSEDCLSILELIEKNNLTQNFIIFNNFVESDTYFSFLSKTDLIMPLVEPGVEFFNTYKNSQITGAYNLAFGFGIPLLYHSALNEIEDLKNFGIEYNSDSLLATLLDINEGKISLESIKSKILSEPKFQKDYQAEKYCSYISSI